jgi:hypothetical protein
LEEGDIYMEIGFYFRSETNRDNGFQRHGCTVLDLWKKNLIKKWSYGCCGRVSWLLVHGQQLPWLLWPEHLIVITQAMSSHDPPLYRACTWPCHAWFAGFVLLIFSEIRGFAHKWGLCMVVPCSFSGCSEEFQFRLLWAYCFYHKHSSISKQNYSKEWRNWKWYRFIWWMKIQHISSKLHKKFQELF